MSVPSDFRRISGITKWGSFIISIPSSTSTNPPCGRNIETVLVRLQVRVNTMNKDVRGGI